MTLTKEDIQLIREALQPDFKSVDNRLNQLQNEMNERFNSVDRGIEKLAQDMTFDTGELIKDLEKRVESLEGIERTKSS